MSNNPTDLQEEEKEKPEAKTEEAQTVSSEPANAGDSPNDSDGIEIVENAPSSVEPPSGVNVEAVPETGAADQTSSETEPVEPAAVTEPVEPVAVSEPVEPVAVSEPVETVAVSEPVEPVAVSEPVEPVAVSEPVEPVAVSEPVETVTPTGASEDSSSEEADVGEDDNKPKIKIGSQREEGAEAVLVPKAVKDAKEKENPLAPVVDAPEPVEVGPSVQDLGAQWEKEAESILEGKSVDELMKTASEGADLELQVNTRIKGTVTKVHGDSVFFLLKGQYDGFLPVRQFKKEPEPGTMTDVVVTGFNSVDNLYELSLPGAAVSVADWSDLEVGKLVEVRITGSNTGGLECSVNNIRGFIPASQIDVSRVDNLGAFINQTMECVITEANKKKKNLVLSRRAILEKELKERKKEILEQFEVGSIIDGKISKLREFGAFVSLGSGVEGLIHISKCSWHHIKHPSEVFSEGQDVSVRIEKVNKETGKIQLSHRDTVEHPWKSVSDKYPVDTTIQGTVSKIADFGAFIKLETGVEGLVHISEIAHERVKSVAAVLNEGQDVEVKILSVDPDKQKMSLSIKALLPMPVREDRRDSESNKRTPPREMAVKKHSKPLKGGTSNSSSGNQFGLKW